MIQFDFDKYCYGCNNCANICPTWAITMYENEEGFQMPVVDIDKCVGCGLCDINCVYLNPPEFAKDTIKKEYYAMYNYIDKDAIEKCSSAGVFHALVEYALSCGWYVSGCIWGEDMQPKHIVTNQHQEAMKMLHSKYAQSDMGACQDEIKDLLTKGEKVLFSGVPCQIAAIMLYTDYSENLYTCDLICKGVPSPGVWRRFVAYIEKKQNAKMTDVRLRSKHRYGWTGPVTKFTFADGSTKETLFFQLNTYIIGFLDGLFMRNSCYVCQYKADDHKGDIILGDFWGINREVMDKSKNKGISAVIVQTDKGKKILDVVKNKFEIFPVTYEEMAGKNLSMTDSTPTNPNRTNFLKDINEVPIQINLKRYTDITSIRKRLILVTYKTGVFRIIKWIKRKLYQ